MICYRHRHLDAIAVCKHCHKGICDACAIDLGANGMACRDGSCAEDLIDLGEMVARNKILSRRLRATYGNQGFVQGGAGVVFLLVGFLSRWPMSKYMMITLGVVLILSATTHYATSRRLAERSNGSNAKDDQDPLN